MKTSVPKQFQFLLLCLTITSSAFAGREVYFPVPRYVSYHDFTKTNSGNSTNYPTGRKLLVGLELYIDVINISNTTQSGTLEFFGVTNFNEVSTASSCCPPRTNIKSTLGLCGTGSFSIGTTTLPSSVTWTAPANKKITISASALHEAYYGTFPNLYGMSMNFFPALKMTINQDKGALLASFRIVLSLATGRNLCGPGGLGGSFTGHYGRYNNNDGYGNIVVVNGGRPF